MRFVRSFYPLKWYCECVCISVCWISTWPHTPCFPGDTQLRVLGGWQRDGRSGGGRHRGVARWAGDGNGDHRRGEVVRGVAGGSCWGGGSKVRRGQAGGMVVGPPCVLVPCPSWALFCGQHLQPALHAKHTLQRGRLHMGLRGPEEKHSWGSAGREGRWVSSAASLSQSLPDEAMGGYSNEGWEDKFSADNFAWIPSLFPCTLNAIVCSSYSEEQLLLH